MKYKVILSLMVAGLVAQAQEQKAMTLEEAAKIYKPTYKTNFKTDMMAFMKNSPIYNGLGFIYVNPNGVSPDITQTVVFDTHLVKVPVTTTTIVDVPYTYQVPVTTTTIVDVPYTYQVPVTTTTTTSVPYTYTVPVTTTWTTTSVIKTEVVTPYSIVSNSATLASYGMSVNIQNSQSASDFANSVLANINSNYIKNQSVTFGAEAESNYWVNNGVPVSKQDVYNALQSGDMSQWGIMGGTAIDNGVGSSTFGTSSAITSVSTPAPYTDSNGVTYRARVITTTTYSAVEDRYRQRAYQWIDTNENGVVDDADTIKLADVHQYGTKTEVTTVDSGETVVTGEKTVIEQHSETHDEVREGTREETVTETHNEDRTGTRQEERTETHNEDRESTRKEEHTETHDEERSETTSRVVENKKNVWKFSFSPILSLDIQTPTKITSLDSQFKMPMASSGAGVKKIEVSSTNKGFLVEKKMAITGAVGGAVVAQYSAWKPGTALTLGMAPIVGTEKIYRTIVKTGVEAENTSIPATPSALNDLKKLKVGDSLSFGQMGGVMFSAGAAYIVANVGVNYIAVGQWKTEIQKVTDSVYYVNRTAVKMNNFGAAIGSTLTLAYTASQFKSADSQFSWLFNAADPQGAKALENFVFKGIALDAQKLSNSQGETTVLKVTKQDNVARGALRTLSMGIPYMTASWGKGRINQTQITQYFPDNTLGDANYSVYMKARDSRMFNWVENSTVAFTAARYNVRDASTYSLQDTGYFGQFAFSYTDTHTKDSELQGVVNQLVALTGMRNELYVEIPKAGNLGYSTVTFMLTFDKSATDFLMALAQDRVASAKLERDAQAFLTGYVRMNKFDRRNDSYNDPIKMCGTVYDYHADACVRQAQQATLDATGEVIVNLRDMKIALERNDRMAFTTAYADLGKSLTSSAFTFQAVLSAAVAGTAGKGVSSSYNLSGTRIKNYTLTPSWDASLVNQVFPLAK
ncbi:hypothetical protein [Bdellovibrio svalbardensis]|uniref:Uncharacterized protein n=1 Tax=Bdellovibrio svalbardensis TaxID=2972972 RepID=A0ABT6DJB0_9BACT|nr:hypothetical protein [Bdellovibrio svalbardensis]MDG0816861.1 hypothetical protein [Bdellovibrio svalbardensis]